MNKTDKMQLVNYAMHYGVILGFFWVFKYLFHIGARYYPTLEVIYAMLGMGTVFFLYYLTVRYRDRINDGHITYLQSVSFATLLCFFASLIEAVVSYLHYTVIDPAYISSINAQAIETLKQLNLLGENIEEIDRLSFSPLYYTVSQIIGNVLIGLILSLLYGVIISKKDTYR